MTSFSLPLDVTSPSARQVRAASGVMIWESDDRDLWESADRVSTVLGYISCIEYRLFQVIFAI